VDPCCCMSCRITRWTEEIIDRRLQAEIERRTEMSRLNDDRYKFHVQKGQAKQRGIPWELEYWEWLQIWQDSGHLEERGCRLGQWVMARNGDEGPYGVGNVKIVRVETNNYERDYSRRRA
jgi:hypothetical protein